MKTPSFIKKPDLGLLILRVGLGIMFIVAHGLPKLLAGPERWTGVGGAMKRVGIEFAPALWGFLAGATELVGGILLILGVFVRPAAGGLVFVMVIATMTVLARGEGLQGANAQPLQVGVACLALVFLGAGKYSLDRNG